MAKLDGQLETQVEEIEQSVKAAVRADIVKVQRETTYVNDLFRKEIKQVLLEQAELKQQLLTQNAWTNQLLM